MSESREAAAELFLLLAAFWQPPDEGFLDELADGSVDATLASLATQAGYSPWRQESFPLRITAPPFSALQNFFFRYIHGAGKDAALPVESLYKRWTEDPTVRLPIAGSTGYLMGDPALHVLYLMDAYSLSVPPAYSMMPDHLALLLELASFLLKNRTPEESDLFLMQHFDWLDSLDQTLTGLTPENDEGTQAQKFYRLALQVLQKAVACELIKETNS